MKIKELLPVFEINAEDGLIRFWKIGNSFILDLKVLDEENQRGAEIMLSLRGKRDIRKFAKALLAEVGE